METNAAPQWNIYNPNCPTRLALDRIADKWTVLIVGRLASGTLRFGELRREINGISPKVLTQKLRELERDGIVTRRIYASIPPRVNYTLTPLGQTLIGLLDSIRLWAEGNMSHMLKAQAEYDQRAPEEE